MSTKREAAHAAVRRCFSVFPIAPNSKVPLISNWQNQATQDPKQIDAWWDEWPDANIAGTTENFVVVDIDPRNGANATMLTLLDIHTFPDTVRNATAGGGDHLIYATDRPVKGGTNKLGQGVDIKARGGYILLPGSTIDGREYKWRNNNPIARAPQWILDQCNLARQKTDKAGKRIVEEDNTAVERATQWMLNSAPSAEYGAIDDTTYKVAARVFDFGVSLETATDIMLEWNELKCNPPGDTERLLVVVESAGVNRENAIGSSHPLAPGFEAVEIDERKAPSSTSSKPVEGMKLERYFAAAEKALSTQAEPLIKGILDRNAMSILYGESNTGKTFIAVDMAFHVAAELAWAKRKVRPGAVVYVAAEGGAGVYKRLAALRQHYPDIGDIPLFIVKYPVDLLHGKVDAAELVRLCRLAASEAGVALELVVIDTLSRAMSGGDENSSTDMGAMVKSFDAIRDATGAHLMVIHHSGKDRARGARGHSLLRAATDTEIEIERGKLAVTKQRDMEGDFKQGFSLKKVNIGLDGDGAIVTSCVVELLAPGAAGQVVIPLTKTQATIVKALQTWLGEDDKHRSFGWKDARTAISDADSDAAVGASTLKEHLKAISDAGHSRKVSENTYVFD